MEMGLSQRKIDASNILSKYPYNPNYPSSEKIDKLLYVFNTCCLRDSKRAILN
jgi:hypothetical protein